MITIVRASRIPTFSGSFAGAEIEASKGRMYLAPRVRYTFVKVMSAEDLERNPSDSRPGKFWDFLVGDWCSWKLGLQFVAVCVDVRISSAGLALASFVQI